MAIEPIFDPSVWARVPFHFWSLVFFVFGCIVGSFLNVCIYRMPLGQSIVSPPSHCPHCKYSIPWWLNVPLLTWLYLRGKCKNCGAPISARYFLVELLTGLMFLSCWLTFGERFPMVALVFCLFLAGLIVATFIDFEHYIIPDEITIGGMIVGFFISFFLPELQAEDAPTGGMLKSFLGICAGAGLIYFLLRAGKLLFGRQKISISGMDRIIFSETSVHLPGQEIPYEEIFYRPSDTIKLNALTVELCDRSYKNVPVRLSLISKLLKIGDEELNPEQVLFMEVSTTEIILPREAMGLGDVKFMGAIGAFLGWQAVFFTVAVSSAIGATVGLTLIALGKRERSKYLPYGPYLAMAAAIWIFFGPGLWRLVFGG